MLAESIIMRRLETIMRVISLGKRADGPGADRIVVPDSSWRERFILLALFSDVIVLYPSPRGGSLWELQWLKRHQLLQKCVFVVPDNFEKYAGTGDLVQLQNIFERLSLALASSPPYGGAVFVLNEDGSLRQQYAGGELTSLDVSNKIKRSIRLIRKQPRSPFGVIWRRYVDLDRREDDSVDSPATELVENQEGVVVPPLESHEMTMVSDWVEQQLE